MANYKQSRTELKRQTHAICRNCFEVLQEYGQVRCCRCLIKLDESRLSFDKFEPLPFRQKASCRVESFVNRSRRWIGKKKTRKNIKCVGLEVEADVCFREECSPPPSSPTWSGTQGLLPIPKETSLPYSSLWHTRGGVVSRPGSSRPWDRLVIGAAEI